jgi:hypothetical protein
MKKNRIVSRLFLFSIIIALVAVLFDVATGIISGWWSVLYFLPLLASPFYFGWGKATKQAVFTILMIFLWIKTESIYARLSGNFIAGTGGIRTRLYIFFISFIVIGVIINFFVKASVVRFFANIRNIILLPGIIKSFTHLVISYCSVIFLYSLLYASIYLSNTNSFQCSREPKLSDFFFYSLYLPTSVTYPLLSPDSMIANCVSFSELVVGLFIMIIYLGIVVGKITSGLERNPELFE